MRELSVACFCDADGVIYPLIEGLHEPVLDQLFRTDQLRGIAIDVLVRRSFGQLINDSADERAQLLSVLKERLEDALQAVEAFENETADQSRSAAYLPATSYFAASEWLVRITSMVEKPPHDLRDHTLDACVDALQLDFCTLQLVYGPKVLEHTWPLRTDAVLCGWQPELVDEDLVCLHKL